MRLVAALFVEAAGCYAGLEGVDPWDEQRDARLYAGPHPVVGHPPCQRWGRYWHGGPSVAQRKVKGDDDGCFASCLANVHRVGGVLEHPEASAAWGVFGINRPPRGGGWVPGGLFARGFTCCVEQGHYGHRARKATWLYACDVELLDLTWGPSEGGDRLPLRRGAGSSEGARRSGHAGCRAVDRPRAHRHPARLPRPAPRHGSHGRRSAGGGVT